MRRWLFALLLAGLGLGNTGCLLNRYPSDPQARMAVLINDSENSRVIEDEWSRWWFTNHPSHLTPNRVDGGMQ